MLARLGFASHGEEGRDRSNVLWRDKSNIVTYSTDQKFGHTFSFKEFSLFS